MRFKVLFVFVMILMVIFACDSKERVPASEAGQPMADPHQGGAVAESHKIVVNEVIQGDTYTYLRATEGSEEIWIATAKQPIEAGMTLYYDKGLEMKDFTSKEVDRTFETIFFVTQLRGPSSAAMNKSAGATASKASNISVEKVSGGMSVAEIYKDMKNLDGKSVTIRGQVTKFNPGIMGRNWVHLQDGSSEGSFFDVTVTTDAMVNKGDVVIFTGTVALDKDFGAGYTYDLIIEDATLSSAG